MCFSRSPAYYLFCEVGSWAGLAPGQAMPSSALIALGGPTVLMVAGSAGRWTD